MAPTTTAVWLGTPPEGVSGFEVVTRPEDAGAPGLLVLDPPPPPRTLRAHLARWRRAGTVVVACATVPFSPLDSRAWNEHGVWCVQRAHLDAASLESLLFSLARDGDLPQSTRLFQALGCVRDLTLRFRSAAEAEHVAHLVAHALPDPQRRLMGLLELLLNAVEHGNLGLDAKEKQRLLVSGEWFAELERRLNCAPWKDRFVELKLKHDADGWWLSVEDEGAGFERPPEVAGAHDLRGRGIMLAREAFDELRWVGRGNRVEARVKS